MQYELKIISPFNIFRSRLNKYCIDLKSLTRRAIRLSIEWPGNSSTRVTSMYEKERKGERERERMLFVFVIRNE